MSGQAWRWTIGIFAAVYAVGFAFYFAWAAVAS